MPSIFCEKCNPKNRHCTKYKVRIRSNKNDPLPTGLQMTRTFSSKRKAEAAGKKLKARFKAGDYSFLLGAKKHYSFSEVAETCIRSSAMNLENEICNLMDRIAQTPFGSAPVDQLQPFHWYELGVYMHDCWGNKPQTVAHSLSSLNSTLKDSKTILRFNVDLDSYSPALTTLRRKGFISGSEARTRRPSEKELNAISAELKRQSLNPRYKIPMSDIFELAILIAARRGELTSKQMCWKNYDPHAKTITITNRKSPRGDKGGKRSSTFELPPEAIEIIERQPRGKDTDPIFPYKSDSVTGAWVRTMKELKIEDLQFRDLRAEALCRLYEKKWDISAISKVSGHRDLNILNNYYLRFFPKQPSLLAA